MFAFFHLALNRMLHTCRGGFDWMIGCFHPCIRTLMVRPFQKVLQTMSYANNGNHVTK